MLKLIGDVGFVVAAVGVLTFSLSFLIAVPWWTDRLGRAIAGVLGSVSIILILSILRLLQVPIPGLFWWRAFVFTAFAATIWAATFAFIWAQFLAPRIKRRSYHGPRKSPIDGGTP